MGKKTRALGEVVKYDAFIITGASSGIGEGFAKFIVCALKEAKRGAKIYNLSRRGTRFDGLENFESIPCDLADLGALASAAERIKRGLRGIAPAPKILLINNAGFGAYGELPAPNLGRNLEMISLNARALTALTGFFCPRLSRAAAL